MIERERSRDCMGKTVVDYTLNRPVDREWLRRLEARYGPVRFSPSVGIYRLNVPHRFLIAGVLGQPRLSVTYKGEDRDADQRELEALLEAEA